MHETATMSVLSQCSWSAAEGGSRRGNTTFTSEATDVAVAEVEAEVDDTNGSAQ
jgi:hypothetical protein